MRFSSLFCLVFCLVFLALPIASGSAADSSGSSIPNEIVQTFQTATKSWVPKLQSFALSLFKLTLLVSIVLFGIKSALSIARGESSLAGIVGEFVMLLLFSGFVIAVLLNYQDITQQLIDKFQEVAGGVSGQKVDVMAPLNTAMNIIDLIKQKLLAINGITAVAEALGFIILGVIVIIALALITAQMILIWCESYVALSASVVLLGIGGGGDIFKDYAINAMRFALAVTFKLFVMQLLMGLGIQFLNKFATMEFTLSNCCIIISVSIILLALVKSIPEICAGIIQGSHNIGGGSLGGAMSTVGTAAVAAMGAGAAFGSAYGGAVEAKNNISKAAQLSGGNPFNIAKTLLNASSAANEQQQSNNPSWGQRIGQNLSTELKKREMGSNSNDQGSA